LDIFADEDQGFGFGGHRFKFPAAGDVVKQVRVVFFKFDEAFQAVDLLWKPHEELFECFSVYWFCE
jgi:hypothetical protein